MTIFHLKFLTMLIYLDSYVHEIQYHQYDVSIMWCLMWLDKSWGRVDHTTTLISNCNISNRMDGWMESWAICMNACSSEKGGVSPLYRRLAVNADLIPSQDTTCTSHQQKKNIVQVFGFRNICFGMKCTWLITASCLVIVLADLVPASYVGSYFEEGQYFYNFIYF